MNCFASSCTTAQFVYDRGVREAVNHQEPWWQNSPTRTCKHHEIAENTYVHSETRDLPRLQVTRPPPTKLLSGCHLLAQPLTQLVKSLRVKRFTGYQGRLSRTAYDLSALAEQGSPVVAAYGSHSRCCSDAVAPRIFGNRPRCDREFKTINTLQRKECSTTGSITTALMLGVVATPCGSSRISRTAESKYFNGRSSRASFGYYVTDKHQSADGAPLLELFFHRRSRYAAEMPRSAIHNYNALRIAERKNQEVMMDLTSLVHNPSCQAQPDRWFTTEIITEHHQNFPSASSTTRSEGSTTTANRSPK